MGKKKRNKVKKQPDWENDLLFESDENYYFIAGVTSGGAAYGITWEEAIAEGLVEREEQQDGNDDELPF
nr:hypothetical protein [uncultured Niameybacter sp.]